MTCFLLGRRGLLLGLAGVFFKAGAAAADESPLAQRLFTMIDGLDVQDKWPAGVHVNWQTGVPDGKPVGTEGKHTHCSAFVASAAMKAGIYILRPPEHSAVLLANAQYDWLKGAGAAKGWTAVSDMYQAQQAANDGEFVVGVYKNHKDSKPGHIVIVRPSDKPRDQITAEGPDITQAGLRNYLRTTVKVGFADHRSAFADNEILYFAHTVDPAALPAA